MVASRLFALIGAATLVVGGPAQAQVAQGDPYARPAYPAPAATPVPPGDPNAPSYQPVDPGYIAPSEAPAPADAPPPPPPPYGPAPADVPAPPPPPYPTPAEPTAPPAQPTATLSCAPRTASAQTGEQAGIPKDNVLTAAENVFGKGAQGLAGLMERIFRDRGEPNAYIAGREAGGAFIVGLRYGSGTMCHKIEGDQKVYWTGPSVGFDAGADANKVFVLVYNLHDSQELFRRYPTAEGRAYLVGGFSASVLKRGDVVLVPIRLGVGLRLGVNAGYMNFSKKSRILPF